MSESYLVGLDGRVAITAVPNRFVWDSHYDDVASPEEGDNIVALRGHNSDDVVVAIPPSCLETVIDAFRRMETLARDSTDDAAVDSVVAVSIYSVNGDTCLQYPSVTADDEQVCVVCGDTLRPEDLFVTIRHTFGTEEQIEPPSVAAHRRCLSDITAALEDTTERADVLLSGQL